MVLERLENSQTLARGACFRSYTNVPVCPVDNPTVPPGTRKLPNTAEGSLGESQNMYTKHIHGDPETHDMLVGHVKTWVIYVCMHNVCCDAPSLFCPHTNTQQGRPSTPLGTDGCLRRQAKKDAHGHAERERRRPVGRVRSATNCSTWYQAAQMKHPFANNLVSRMPYSIASADFPPEKKWTAVYGRGLFMFCVLMLCCSREPC